MGCTATSQRPGISPGSTQKLTTLQSLHGSRLTRDGLAWPKWPGFLQQLLSYAARYYKHTYVSDLSNLVRQTTDGETEPTIERAVRRVDATSIEIEVVTCQTSRPIVVNGRSRSGPIVAIDAKIPDRTIITIDVPATDEVKAIVARP